MLAPREAAWGNGQGRPLDQPARRALDLAWEEKTPARRRCTRESSSGGCGVLLDLFWVGHTCEGGNAARRRNRTVEEFPSSHGTSSPSSGQLSLGLCPPPSQPQTRARGAVALPPTSYPPHQEPHAGAVALVDPLAATSAPRPAMPRLCRSCSRALARSSSSPQMLHTSLRRRRQCRASGPGAATHSSTAKEPPFPARSTAARYSAAAPRTGSRNASSRRRHIRLPQAKRALLSAPNDSASLAAAADHWAMPASQSFASATSLASQVRRPNATRAASGSTAGKDRRRARA